MKSAPAVRVAAAVPGDILATFDSDGTVEAPFTVKIAPKVAGRIEFLEVREGDHVSRGQVVARVDPSEVEAQVRQQEAAVAEAQSRLAQAQATQGSTNVGVRTQIDQQKAAVASAQADQHQAEANYNAQVAAANAAVTDA